MGPSKNARRVREIARKLGFDACGIATAAPIGRADYVRSWLNRGRAGSMEYLHRHLPQRLDVRELLPGAKSVIVTAQVYNQPAPGAVPHGHGRVAKYAWGRDYHKVLKAKLWRLVDELRRDLEEPFEAKICVDTAPILEREWAAAAGLGWIGKNTLVLNPALGSYFFLGAVVVTLELEPDDPIPNHCGTCTACLEACPTSAFPAAFEMDASRCISYLTIEHRGDISAPFQEKMGDWLFGCDVCQEVCPFNRLAPTATEPHFQARNERVSIDPTDIAQWEQADYQKALTGSAMKRATLPMMQRNAAIVRANSSRADPQRSRHPVANTLQPIRDRAMPSSSTDLGPTGESK